MGIISILLLLLVIVFTAGVLIFGQNIGLTAEFLKQYSNFSMIVASLLAFVMCLMSASKYERTDETKTAWIFVGLGSLSFCVAQVIFVFMYGQLNSNAPPPPFPAWSDIFYLLSPLLMAYGLFNLRKSLRSIAPSWGAFLALFVGIAAIAIAFMVQWSSIIVPTTSSLAIIATVMYAFFDPIMLGFSVLALSMMIGGLVSRPWWMIIVALATIYAGNIIFNITNINETYYVGHLVDVTWPLAFGLIAVAAVWNREMLR